MSGSFDVAWMWFQQLKLSRNFGSQCLSALDNRSDVQLAVHLLGRRASQPVMTVSVREWVSARSSEARTRSFDWFTASDSLTPGPGQAQRADSAAQPECWSAGSHWHLVAYLLLRLHSATSNLHEPRTDGQVKPFVVCARRTRQSVR